MRPGMYTSRMQLLVSVRNASEARTALAGGADIIDAKEPGNGPLGPVALGVLEAIARVVPATTPLSAALGDGGCHALLAAIAATPVLAGRRAWFAKFALTGPTPGEAREALCQAHAHLASRADAPRLILARYADRGLHDINDWLAAAATSGTWGVLLDTAGKQGSTLLDVASVSTLQAIATRARRLGLHLALAGGLGAEHLAQAAATGAHVVGVRGAACDGGRGGKLCVEKVAALRAQLNAVSAPRAAAVLQGSPT